jgi:hypothetical protein
VISLVKELVTFELIGEMNLKGVQKPVSVAQVIGTAVSSSNGN